MGRWGWIGFTGKRNDGSDEIALLAASMDKWAKQSPARHNGVGSSDFTSILQTTTKSSEIMAPTSLNYLILPFWDSFFTLNGFWNHWINFSLWSQIIQTRVWRGASTQNFINQCTPGMLLIPLSYSSSLCFFCRTASAVPQSMRISIFLL